ncbi:hypothetical protein YBT1518_19180 [Bacillus thuringiensis YBT-1518]|jgi:hypothetical protein|uniref:Uncharacterized protein n=1 Tax=Bacillus thuringiensis YBT-1518 TaxID=529122 RepID=A0A9W3KDS8_BACTU|nr:hypothetical protein YBT1518_19180 [Bacillus thuringiensis YBT-1518]
MYQFMRDINILIGDLFVYPYIAIILAKTIYWGDKNEFEINI